VTVVVIPALINSTDETVQFLLHNPIDALLAVEVSHKEYLLVFASKCGNAKLLHYFRVNAMQMLMIGCSVDRFCMVKL